MTENLEIIEQAKTNNAILEKLMNEYEPMMYSLVKTFSVNGYTTEDLMQEARLSFCKAVRKFDTKSENKLSTFVYLVVKRRLNDLNKAQFVVKRRGEVIPITGDEESAPVYEIPSLDPDPLEQVLIEEKRQELGRALRGKLTETEFDIAILFANGYSYEDIAKLLNVTKKQVDNALQRVRKKLKD